MQPTGPDTRVDAPTAVPSVGRLQGSEIAIPVGPLWESQVEAYSGKGNGSAERPQRNCSERLFLAANGG